VIGARENHNYAYQMIKGEGGQTSTQGGRGVGKEILKGGRGNYLTRKSRQEGGGDSR